MKDNTLHAARRLQTQVEARWARYKGKKNAVLHLRIEEEVMERLKAEAKARELSVSDFVRLRLVESFSGPLDVDPGQDFLLATTAWTEAVIMQETPCALCGESMPKGAMARLANGPPLPARLICLPCYGGLLAETGDNQLTEKGDER